MVGQTDAVRVFDKINSHVEVRFLGLERHCVKCEGAGAPPQTSGALTNRFQVFDQSVSVLDELLTQYIVAGDVGSLGQVRIQ